MTFTPDSPSGFSLCRMAGDESQPCPFTSVCHESRQRIAHYEGLRGNACSWYQGLVSRRRDLLPMVDSPEDHTA